MLGCSRVIPSLFDSEIPDIPPIFISCRLPLSDVTESVAVVVIAITALVNLR